MTQIVVTLEDDSNASVIRNAIRMIKGVKDAMLKKHVSANHDDVVAHRLNAFDKLAGSVPMSKIDMEDDRTRYLLSK